MTHAKEAREQTTEQMLNDLLCAAHAYENAFCLNKDAMADSLRELIAKKQEFSAHIAALAPPPVQAREQAKAEVGEALYKVLRGSGHLTGNQASELADDILRLLASPTRDEEPA